MTNSILFAIVLILLVAGGTADRFDELVRTTPPPTCTSAHHIKITPGDPLFPNVEGEQTITLDLGGGHFITLFDVDIRHGLVDRWFATTPIFSIIMKGGPGGAWVYTYDPPAMSDDVPLHTTENKFGILTEISNIQICWYNFLVFQSQPQVATHCDTRFVWEVDTEAPQDCIMGDTCGEASGEINAQNIILTKTETQENIYVDGDFVVSNPDLEFDAVVTAIVIKLGDEIVSDVSCVPLLAPPIVLAKNGGYITCTFHKDYAALPIDLTLSIEVSASGLVLGSSVSGIQVEFECHDPIDDCVELLIESDPALDPFPMTQSICVAEIDPISFTVPLPSVGPYEYTFTVTVGSEGHQDSGTFTMSFCGIEPACVAVHALGQAVVDFVTTTNWDFTVTQPPICLLVQPSGYSFFDATPYIQVCKSSENSGWVIHGSFEVVNQDEFCPADISGIVVKTGSSEMTVTCYYDEEQVVFPFSLSPGASLYCDFLSAVLDSEPDQDIKVEVSLTGELDLCIPNPFIFPIDEWFWSQDEIDDCIKIGMSTDPSQARVMCEAVVPHFEISIPPGGPECIDLFFYLFKMDESEAYDVIGPIHVCRCPTSPPPPEDDGCTYTQGYWKNHLLAWPAHSDDPFFLSEREWPDVYTGDGKSEQFCYYKLAHQYVAAVLNGLNGASVPPEVSDAKAFLEGIVFLITPESSILNLVCTDEMLAKHDILADYNEGKAGVPHCSDEIVKK